MAGTKADVFKELKKGLGWELTCTDEAGREGRRDTCKGTQMMFRFCVFLLRGGVKVCYIKQ